MGKKDALAPDDWIRAGFRALSAGGIGAVRVEPIAKALKVSKGSFYWHFKDVASLRSAMLAHWSERSTFEVIDALSGTALNSRQKLAELIDIATNEGSADYGGLSAETALREWARIDAAANSTLVQTERARLTFMAALLKESGFGAQRAAELAEIMYAGLIGLQALEANELSDARARLHDLLEILLA